MARIGEGRTDARVKESNKGIKWSHIPFGRIANTE
jgi:hypothetical protein